MHAISSPLDAFHMRATESFPHVSNCSPDSLKHTAFASHECAAKERRSADGGPPAAKAIEPLGSGSRAPEVIPAPELADPCDDFFWDTELELADPCSLRSFSIRSFMALISSETCER